MSTPDNELTELEIKLGTAMSAVLQVQIEVEKLQAENSRLKEALEKIVGCHLHDFMGPNDLALELKAIARAALGGKK